MMYSNLDAQNCGFGEENIDESDNDQTNRKPKKERTFSSRFEKLYDNGLEAKK